MTQPPIPPQYPSAPYPAYPPQPPRRDNTTLWVLLAVVGVLLLVCGGCATSVLLAAGDTQDTGRTAVSTPPPGGPAEPPPGSGAPRTSAPRTAPSTPSASSNSQNTTNQDAFIATLDREGIYYSSRQAALDMGVAICEERAAGATDVEMATALTEKGYSSRDAAYLVVAAQMQFCPEYA
ncbi:MULTISPECIES: DUF732 domain-containing protein [Nocardia]|uniref:DUF732 domain-containing protein n=1 Tax=Nocardia TaxID=1817 RepID=UPI00293107E2|nr:DUF732 domain-containing protein [Nocardia canadensis]